MSSLAATLLKACAVKGDKIKFRLQRSGDYRAVSGKEFYDNTLRVSKYLAEHKVSAGDRVILVAENSPEWITMALAVLNRGATLVPVAAVATTTEVDAIINKAQPKFILFSEAIAAAESLRSKNRLAAFSWNSESDAPLDEIIKKYSPDSLSETVEENSIAILIYTSGTTGNPKAVPLSHKNILVNAQSVPTVLKVSRRDRLVSVLPLSHMLEFTCGFVSPVLLGAQITYAKSIKGEDIVRALKDTRATIMVGVPLLYEIIARSLRAKLDAMPKILHLPVQYLMGVSEVFPIVGKIFFFPLHLAFGGFLRFFVAGGSRLHPDTFRFFRGIGIRMVQGYGLTETSPVLAITDPNDNDADYVGRALPSVEVGVFSSDGTPAPVGVEGEIWARGPSVFSGYLDASQNAEVFHGEWFRTGDLGIFDYRKMLRITGRKKDIIVTAAGKNIYPEEIESLVLASGRFLEAAALGMKDGNAERVVLVVVPDRSKFPQLAEDTYEKEVVHFTQSLCKSLSDYKWPQRIVVMHEELPKTITRKIKKHELRASIEKSDQSGLVKLEKQAGRTLDLKDGLESTVANAIASIRNINPDQIKSSDILNRDLGIDSLTFVEIIGAVEKKFSTVIDGAGFAEIITVEDLLSSLRTALEKTGKIKARKVRFVEFEPAENTQPYWAWPRRFLNVFMRAGLKIHYRMTAYGIEHIRDGGPFVFTPNHGSHFDTLAIAASIPGKDVHYTFAVAAKDYFFNKTWKAAVARLLINAIPFDRKMRIDESMARCGSVLEHGGSLIIFPEGTRSPTGQIQDFKPGVGRLLAGREKVRAVPVYISGAHDILPKGSRLPRGTGVHLKVYFGEPISFEEFSASPEAYKEIAQKLQAEVMRLEKLHQSE